MIKTYVTGSGGGKSAGGTGRTAVEVPDSLRSMATARIQDLICEGEIEGLANGMRSVFLDETPLENEDGSFNFQNVTVQLNVGSQHQSYIPGFGESESEHSVGAEVKAAVPITRQVADANINAVRITVAVPQLYSQDKSAGDINGASVELAIDVQASGGAWTTVKTDTITGKTMSRYQRAYRVPLSGSAPWQIRVRRISADPTDSALQNKLYWDGFTEIIEAKLRYPNSAIVAITADASQFSSIPKRAYDMLLQRIKVPSNYNPETREYTGIWDGTFKTAWTDNPAWGFYAIATHERYGLGRQVPEALMDKWTLYQIGRYCDELVPDGFGGLEPRFTLNVYISTRVQAFKLLNDLASVFRGMAYYAGGVITAVQDAPADPGQPFSNANVLDGRFQYSGTAKRARHTVALVAYNDPADFDRQKVEYVDDPAGIRRYGINSTEVTAIGCRSRGQAHRVGKWLLYSEQEETETVTFRTGLDGVYLRPGNVIPIFDRHRAGKRMSGRIKSAAGTTVVLDALFELEAEKSYTMSCVLPDGTTETRAITSAPGTVAEIEVATPFGIPPQEQAVWAITADDLAPTLWRVLAVTEPEKHQVEITALEHNPDKYSLIEQGIALQPSQTSNLPSAGLVEPPPNLTVTEELYPAAMGVSGVRLLISWERSPNLYVQSYICEIRRAEGNWISLPVDGYTAQYDGATQGNYQVRVVAINVLGVKSSPTELVYRVIAMTAPPANVTGLQIYGKGNSTEFDGRECRLTWNKVSTSDAGGAADGPAGEQPPEGWFKDYVLKVYNEDGSLRRGPDFITTEAWNYSYERNYQDGNGTAARNFTVEVVARDRWHQTSEIPARISVSNPPPRKLTAGEIALNAFANAFTVDVTPIGTPDVEGYLIYASQQAGFTPTADTVIGKKGTHVYKSAAAGSWYVRAAAYDTFGQDTLLFSDEYSCTVIEPMVLPDQLYTSLRTDFWVLDSIFYFNAQVLTWSAGYIVRGESTFTLQAGTLPNAAGMYVIAGLSGGVATLRLAPLSAGIPGDLSADDVIIAITSSQPLSNGNYVCYIRQANSMQLEGLLVRLATITDAHITGTLSASRIVNLNGTVTIDANGTVTLAEVHQTGVDAQYAADWALGEIADISADDRLTPVEKYQLLKEMSEIQHLHAMLDAEAAKYGLPATAGTVRALHDAAMNALTLNVNPVLANMGITSTIDGVAFRTLFSDFYLAHKNLRTAVTNAGWDKAAAAAATADWNSISSMPPMLGAPSGNGLYLTPTTMGYYKDNVWKTYMDNQGRMALSGSGTHSLFWDGTFLTVRGDMLVNNLTGGEITGASFFTSSDSSAIGVSIYGDAHKIVLRTPTDPSGGGGIGAAIDNTIVIGGTDFIGAGKTQLARFGTLGTRIPSAIFESGCVPGDYTSSWGYVYSYASPVTAGKFYAVGAAGLYKSINYGISWQQVSVGGVGSTIIPHSTIANYLYTTLVSGGTTILRKSTNDGASWSSLYTFPTSYWPIVRVAPSNGDVIYASMAASTYIMVSTNGGTTWAVSNLPAGAMVYEVATHPTDPSVVFACVTSRWWSVAGGYSNFRSKIYRSDNYGGSWTEVGQNLTTVTVSNNIVRPVNNSPGNAMTAQASILVDPSNTNRWYVNVWGVSIASHDGVWRTDNAGGTWIKVTQPSTGHAIKVTSTGRVLSGLQYSDDYGATWNWIPNKPAGKFLVACSPPGGSLLLASSQWTDPAATSLAVSTDFGASWSSITSPDVPSNGGNQAVVTVKHRGSISDDDEYSDGMAYASGVDYATLYVSAMGSNSTRRAATLKANDANALMVINRSSSKPTVYAIAENYAYTHYSNRGGYAPFTGCHDGLVLKGTALEVGDILVDVAIVGRNGVSDTIAQVEPSATSMQSGAIGIFRGYLVSDLETLSLVSGLSGHSDLEGIYETYDVVAINALGEGQMNVCNEGGDIRIGDLICTSSIPGKGMKQPDDLYRQYTVAKARESVTWESGDNSIRLVACTYHCG